MLGRIGCGGTSERCGGFHSGFCGGGGVAISRAAAEALAAGVPGGRSPRPLPSDVEAARHSEAPLSAFVQGFVENCFWDCGGYGDRTLAELGRRIGARVGELENVDHAGLNQEREVVKQMLLQGISNQSATSVVPLTFHYLKTQHQYEEIHRHLL